MVCSGRLPTLSATRHPFQRSFKTKLRIVFSCEVALECQAEFRQNEANSDEKRATCIELCHRLFRRAAAGGFDVAAALKSLQVDRTVGPVSKVG